MEAVLPPKATTLQKKGENRRSPRLWHCKTLRPSASVVKGCSVTCRNMVWPPESN